jgi:hypothetical protein
MAFGFGASVVALATKLNQSNIRASTILLLGVVIGALFSHIYVYLRRD